MDIQQLFNESISEVLKNHDQKEVAARLYDIYGLKCSWHTWYAHIRKCFSKDDRERFEFCDVFWIMHEFGCLEPIYAICDLLQLSRPEPLSQANIIRAKIRSVNRLRSRVRTETRELARIQAGVVEDSASPQLTHARFSIESRV